MALNPSAARGLGLVFAAAALALDQGSKLWLLRVYGLDGRPPLRLAPFLDLVMAWNRGVSYSLLRADTPVGRWALFALAIGAVVALAFWLWRAQSGLVAAALGLIIGGALGNAADRFSYGAVADFLHFHTAVSLGPLSNYVFNIADAAITIGVALLLFDSFFASRPQAEAKI